MCISRRIFSPLLPVIVLMLLAAGGMNTQAAGQGKKNGMTPSKKSKNPKLDPLPVPPPAPDNPKPEKGKGPEVLPSYRTPASAVERFKKLIPATYAKLSQRQPVHVVVLGDEISDMAGYGEPAGNQLLAWPVRLVDELASEFYYTGGVRLIRPNPGKPERALDAAGPEITVRVFDEIGGTMPKALSLLATYAQEAAPDLVIVSFGVHDTLAGSDLMDYAKSLHRVVEIVRSRGADLVLAGPTLLTGDNVENGIAATRALGGVVRDEAEESGVAFVDLGEISSLVHLEEDEIQAPDKMLDVVSKQYRQFFAWDGVKDVVHPLPALHAKLGRQAFKSLAEAPAALPWKIGVMGASLSGTDQCTLRGTIENTSAQPLKLSLQALKLPRWEPKSAPVLLDFKPGQKLPLQLDYQRTASPRGELFPAFPGHEPLLRLPVLLASSGVVRLESLKAQVKPLAVLWKLDTLFNQEGQFSVDNVVVNTSDADAKGIAWTAEWNGQKKNGSIDIAKGKDVTLPLAFDLPKGAGPRRIATPLRLTLNLKGSSLQWERSVEINQNFGLKQELPLTAVGQGKDSVVLTTAATDTSLVLTFDLGKAPLEASAGAMAVVADINLDARSYGKRLTMGCTEAISVSTGATDGSGKTGNIAPWSFGTGYGMKFDPSAVTSKLSTNLGLRTLTVTVPRSYLYLHEWAVGNGNSQMGINARLRFARGKEGFSRDSTYALTNNGKQGDDAEGLAVLELSEKPTTRWTVIVW